mgnify:CR=1 FL=1
MAGQLILALAILVSLHEWGHYIASRAFGIKVEKFFIFFDAWGIKLFSKKVNDTEWGIGWLPLGGYVKISGMIDESLDKDQLESQPEDFEFRSKPAWQRLIVMIGGVTVNFILGILIFALSLWFYGEQWLPTSTVNNGDGIFVTEIGKKVGLEHGDKVLKVNGEEVERFRSLQNPSYLLEDSELSYEIERQGTKQAILVPDSIKKEILESKGNSLFSYRFAPVIGKMAKKGGAKEADLKVEDKIITIEGKEVKFFDELGPILQSYKSKSVAVKVKRGEEVITTNVTLDTAGKMGFNPTNSAHYKGQYQVTKYGFFESFPEGTKRGLSTLMLNINAFKQMFQGKLNPVKTMSGPFQIAGIYGSTWDWHKFWQITGMLSFILAFMNLLPIPALDGGHVLFLLIEMLRGKPLPEKVMYYFQIVGMIILFALMAFVLIVDGLSLFGK